MSARDEADRAPFDRIRATIKQIISECECIIASRPQAAPEQVLPANVPLHKRGFGVMDEDGS
jgi:hypothetical protein